MTIKRQLDNSLDMLNDIIYVYPADHWRLIFHALYWLDYNLQEKYDGSKTFCWQTDKNITHDLNNADCIDCLTQNELTEYIKAIILKKESVFNNLTDVTLTAPLTYRNDGLLLLDLLINQIRHIMYHVGYINNILNDNNTQPVQWRSIYNDGGLK